MKALLERVDEILVTRTEPSDVLSSLRNMAPLPHLLDVVRADQRRLAGTANASYRHRNGFDKIVLASPPGSPLKLVLHLWEHGDLDGEIDHIHNHRWNFASIVLRGALRYELYKSDPRGRSYSKIRYQRLPQSRSYELTPCGSMTVSAHATAVLAEGSTYTWHATMLHRAWAVPGQNTATLIVQGPPVRRSTTVLVDTERCTYPPPTRPQLRQLEVDYVDQALARLATHEPDADWYSDLDRQLTSDSCLTS
jgi:hypothetical protein